MQKSSPNGAYTSWEAFEAENQWVKKITQTCLLSPLNWLLVLLQNLEMMNFKGVNTWIECIVHRNGFSSQTAQGNTCFIDKFPDVRIRMIQSWWKHAERLWFDCSNTIKVFIRVIPVSCWDTTIHNVGHELFIYILRSTQNNERVSLELSNVLSCEDSSEDVLRWS